MPVHILGSPNILLLQSRYTWKKNGVTIIMDLTIIMLCENYENIKLFVKSICNDMSFHRMKLCCKLTKRIFREKY